MNSEAACPQELYCPVAPRMSPFADALDAYVADWMASSGMHKRPDQLGRHCRSGYGTFAARVCPDAGWERLCLYARWLAFGFFYDDEFFDESDSPDQGLAAADAAMAAISVFMPDGLPPLCRWADIDRRHRLSVPLKLLEETREVAGAEQFGRFCNQMTLWFYSYLYEPAFRSTGKLPTLAGYITNRLYNIASAPYVTLSEIVAGCAVSAEELSRPDVRLLSSLAAYQMAWCNDIHSAIREASVNNLIVNLPSLLRSNGGAGARPAMTEAVRIHDETMDSYLRLEETVRSGAPATLLHYLDILRTWMRGHYDWCRRTARYSAPAAADAASQAAPVVERGRHERTRP